MAVEEAGMTSVEIWPVVAVSLSALVVFLAGGELLERYRIRTRRDRLRSRLTR